jgi:hypothetical protein
MDVAPLIRSPLSTGFGLDLPSGAGFDHLTDLGLRGLRLDAGEHPLALPFLLQR